MPFLRVSLKPYYLGSLLGPLIFGDFHLFPAFLLPSPAGLSFSSPPTHKLSCTSRSTTATHEEPGFWSFKYGSSRSILASGDILLPHQHGSSRPTGRLANSAYSSICELPVLIWGSVLGAPKLRINGSIQAVRNQNENYIVYSCIPTSSLWVMYRSECNFQCHCEVYSLLSFSLSLSLSPSLFETVYVIYDMCIHIKKIGPEH